MKRIILTSPDIQKPRSGNGIVVFLATATALAGVGFTVYDYYQHGRQWFWHRFREENSLREREGMTRLPLLEQLRSLFAADAETW